MFEKLNLAEVSELSEFVVGLSADGQSRGRSIEKMRARVRCVVDLV